MAIVVYADGSALGNPGPGGRAYIIVDNGARRSDVGGVKMATNNQMELTAATRALAALPREAEGVLRSDSEYVVKGVTEWRPRWEQLGLDTRLNADLWRNLFREVDAHPWMRLEWVRGHGSDRFNQEVDILARATATCMRDGIAIPSAQSRHPLIGATITKLEGYIAKLEALGRIGATTEIDTICALYGDHADRWLLAKHPKLGEAPIDVLLRGDREAVLDLIDVITGED